MEVVLQAVLPIFGVIWLGYFFKRYNMPGDDFWPLAERITYFVFLPTLFFMNIVKADFASLDNLFGLIMAVVSTTFIVSILSFVAQYGWLKLNGKNFASFYQGAIRFNNYIAIPIIISLFAQKGLVIYAVIIAVSIPLTNVLVIAVMSHYASDREFSIKNVLVQIAKNPLIIGPFLGLVVNLCHIPLYYAEDMLTFFAQAASALGLLTVGAAIDFESIRTSKRNLLAIGGIKLVVSPIVMYFACIFFAVDGLARDVAIVYAALPVAASSYILAKQFGANAVFMSSITVITTLMCMASLPILLIFLHL